MSQKASGEPTVNTYRRRAVLKSASAVLAVSAAGVSMGVAETPDVATGWDDEGTLNRFSAAWREVAARHCWSMLEDCRNSASSATHARC